MDAGISTKGCWDKMGSMYKWKLEKRSGYIVYTIRLTDELGIASTENATLVYPFNDIHILNDHAWEEILPWSPNE